MYPKSKQFLLLYKWPLLSGLFIGTTFIPFPPWALLFCFVPLWWFWYSLIENSKSEKVERSTLKKIFIGGFLTQFLLTLIGFNWVAHTIHEFGHLPWAIALLGLLAFCVFANLHIPLAGVIWFWTVKKIPLSSAGKILLLALLISFFELHFPMIFDWHFGYTWLWAGLPGIQTAEIWGAKFLSAFSILLNALVLIGLVQWRRHQKKQATQLVCLVALLFAAINFYGMFLKKQLPKPNKQLNTLVVQANIGNLEKQYELNGFRFRDKIYSDYTRMTLEAYKNAPEDVKIDFAIWPETAFPDRMNPSGPATGLGLRLRRFLKQNQIALVAGTYGNAPPPAGVSNSIFIFNEFGELLQPTYTKTTLLAFGEYIPGGDWFPMLYQWLPQVARFARGTGPIIQTFDDLKIGPQICYEGLFDHFSRQSAQLGSEVLINLTNDSWFGLHQEPYQHLYMTLTRAIEVRRPLIRSTNTGISSVILANGEILDQSPLHKTWTHIYNVPYLSNPPLTLFSRWGYWLVYLFWILLGVYIFAAKRSYRH